MSIKSTFTDEFEKQNGIKILENKKDIHTPSNTNKIVILRNILKNCIVYSKLHKRKYKKMKKFDDIIDVSNSLLSGVSIGLLITGFEFPPLLIGSACLSGVHFVSSRLQDKYNFKLKYSNHHISLCQYNNLAREITAVLSKNNLSNQEYQNYIEECNDKISLIEDTQIF